MIYYYFYMYTGHINVIIRALIFVDGKSVIMYAGCFGEYISYKIECLW